MALTATLWNLEIALADVDRGVYETLPLRVAQHPSETLDYMLTRVLAYCLEYEEGIEFPKGGLSEPDVPAVWVRDLTGRLRVWIDVGLPDAERLNRASKSADRVAVYTHRDPATLKRQLAGKRIHRGDEIEIRAIEPAFLATLVPLLDRRTAFDLSLTGGQLYATVGDRSATGTIEAHRLE
jgi:uncharacterized protein YaeQ